MRRRDFVAGIAVAAAWPLGAHSRRQRMPVIGYLATGSREAFASRVAAMQRGLGEQGYVEDRNVAIEYRWADGDYDRLPAFASGLVDRKVDVIVAAGPPALRAARGATSTIPVVFVIGSDPVRDGFVTSMSRPGGNLTGFSFLAVDLTPKRLELVAEMVPRAKLIGLMANPSNAAEQRVVSEIRSAGSRTGIEVLQLPAGSANDIDVAFATAGQRKVDLMIVSPDSLFTTRAAHIVSLAARYSIPAIYSYRQFVTAGGLASYGPDVDRSYYEAGIYAGRILEGSEPGGLPIMQPTSFELVLNMKTAKSLGIEMPPTLLARADEVIE
jgi:putative ABC transport system substrate-binding protein